MPCALDFSETAAEDFQRLLDSIPLSRQERALIEIEAVCRTLANNPPSRSFGTFPLTFEVDGVHYYWAGTYRLNLDQTKLTVTHVFRRPPL